MSRIDEALRRVVADPSNRERFASGPAAIVSDLSIGQYAAERSTPAESAPTQSAPTQGVAEPEAAAVRASITSQGPRPWRRFTTFHESLEEKVVTGRETDAAVVEQYRRLATTLLAARSERGLKALMVSSAIPGEGKTLTIVNLALTLSESYGKRVLLIDADFRRPMIHKLFGISNKVGLTDVLKSGNGRLELFQFSSKLSVLVAGDAGDNPMSELSSDAMQALVTDAAAQFDWVLLDTPPVGVLSDAHLIARVADGVLFVIAAGMAPYNLVQRSIREIGVERIVGTVLNRVEARRLPTHGYYGSQYGERNGV